MSEDTPPMITARPPRTPIVRLPSTDSSAQQPLGPSSARLGRRGSASNVDRAPATPPSNAPATTPSRALDREKILERYKRPSERTRAPEESTPGKSASDVQHARDQFRRDQEPRASAHAQRKVDEVKSARDSFVARKAAAADVRAEKRDDAAKSVKGKRDVWRAEQELKLDKRETALAEARTKRLRDLASRDPERAKVLWSHGKALSHCHSWHLNWCWSIGLGWCSPYGGAYWSNCFPWWYWNSWDECGSYWYWWGAGAYSYSWCAHPFAWTWYWNYHCWPSYSTYWWPNCTSRYYYSPPVYYSTVLVDRYEDDQPDVVIYDYDDDNDVVVVGGNVQRVDASEPFAVGESVQAPAPRAERPAVDPTVAGVLERGPDSQARVATQYLADGDRAFRERRYGDAAHLYAKAIEFRPDEGALYLVLADALFATGDYHYGAFALRRALELDAKLAASDFDKHEFYVDPSEFDRQLQLLERFLADHPTDGDARLLLAANYLFSKKPKLTIDLLEAGSSQSVRDEPAGKLLLDAAKAALQPKN